MKSKTSFMNVGPGYSPPQLWLTCLPITATRIASNWIALEKNIWTNFTYDQNIDFCWSCTGIIWNENYHIKYDKHCFMIFNYRQQKCKKHFSFDEILLLTRICISISIYFYSINTKNNCKTVLCLSLLMFYICLSCFLSLTNISNLLFIKIKPRNVIIINVLKCLYIFNEVSIKNDSLRLLIFFFRRRLISDK